MEKILLADWTRTIARSVLQDIRPVALQPGIFPFALGLPASNLFPKDAYTQAIIKVLDTDPHALQYGPPFQPLKSHIVALMAQRGVICVEEQVFLTSGAQQGISLLAHILLNPGGQVLVERTTYEGLRMAIGPYQPEILTVQTDLETGLDVDAVEALLERDVRPTFIYLMTDGHNPLGANLSPMKRARIVSLARRFGVPIVEDDAYGFLNYEGGSAPPLRALDEDWVFYVGTFSKILAPALRVGWVIAPKELISKLSIAKQASDLDITSFTQRTISAYLDAGHMPGHINTLCCEYAARRDVMSAAMQKYLPIEVRWRKPPSGMYIWVELPQGVDTAELLTISIKTEQVAFVPGHAFSSDDDHYATRCLRLNFSNCDPEFIEEGIVRLGKVLKRILR